MLELYDAPPTDGRVVCVDEFGPLNLQPRKGKNTAINAYFRWHNSRAEPKGNFARESPIRT
ncbi:hypothetical protein [Streptomyces sp. NPDC058548]|uniref:hypothetical protein n=1 Tax=Streptomyces sp. NPDC058548 TaxID=3346545 RepID=UPI0036631020